MTLLSLFAAPVYAQDWAKTGLEALVVYPEVKSKARVIDPTHTVPGNKIAREEECKWPASFPY